jgi:hypothetical protein
MNNAIVSYETMMKSGAGAFITDIAPISCGFAVSGFDPNILKIQF